MCRHEKSNGLNGIGTHNLSNKSDPTVSFVIPCYNYGRYLLDCLEGIFNQTGNYSIEIILIDDGSTDNTRDLLCSIDDSRLQIITHNSNQGHISTVNEGLKATKGKYVVRVDPDDRHRSIFLDETIPILENYPLVGLVYSDVALIDHDGKITREKVGSKFGNRDRMGFELIEVMKSNYICAPTVVARREAWMSAWPLPKGLAFNDWYFNVMLARRYQFYYVNKVLAEYRVHNENHHVKVIANKTEEASIMKILDMVYNEVEKDPDLETRKRRHRDEIYANQYLDLARKYFEFRFNEDAKRCYWEAIKRRPALMCKADVARQWLGTIVGRNLYDKMKSLSRPFVS